MVMELDVSAITSEAWGYDHECERASQRGTSVNLYIFLVSAQLDCKFMMKGRA